MPIAPTFSAPQERDFQDWYAGWAKTTGLSSDPDDPRHKYDYRSAYTAGAVPSVSEEDRAYHWPSQFKSDDHPNRFVGGVDTKTGEPGNEYDALLAEHNGAAALALRTSLAVAGGASPEEEAGLLSLSKKTGVPVEALRAPSVKVQAEAQATAAPDADRIAARAPKTAQFFSDPGNARVAHDDVEHLASLEELLYQAGDQFRREVPEAVSTLGKTFVTGQKETELGRLGYRIAAEGSTPELEGQVKDLKAQIDAVNQVNQEAEGFIGSFLLPAAKLVGQVYETGKKAVGTGMVSGMALGGAGTAFGGVGALPGFVAGFSAGTAAGFVKDTMLIEGGQAYLAMRDIRGNNGEKLPEETLRTAATTVGLVNALIEGASFQVVSAPFKRALSRSVMAAATKSAVDALATPTTRRALTRFGKEYATAIAAETGQEILQEVTNVVAEELSKATAQGEFKATDAQTVGQRLWGIASEMSRAMVVMGAFGPGMNLRSDLRAARAGEANRSIFEALGKAAGESKLISRLPDKAREFVEAVTAGGPVEAVSVPVERWTAYFQEKGLDPGAIAAQVLSDPMRYEQAVATGSDIVIPMPEYVAHLAATEHHAGLIDDLRLRPGDATVREAREYRAAHKETLDAQEEVVKSSEAKIFADIYDQLVGTGRVIPSVAMNNATLQASVFRSLGSRAGIDPWELYQRYAPQIVGPQLDPEAAELLNVPVTESDIRSSQNWKAMAETLAEEKYKGKKFSEGVPLLERLGKAGRLKVSSAELRGLSAWENGLAPYFTTKQRIAKGEALKWDVAVRSLVEEGYLPEDADLNDLVEAIARDQKAKRIRGARVTPGGVSDLEIARLAAKSGYFQEAAPRTEHGDYKGWTYDGEWPDTEYHQYTDRSDPSSITWHDTVLVKNPEDLPARIEKQRAIRIEAAAAERPVPHAIGPLSDRPAGERWTVDPGAIPGEPVMYLDGDEETATAVLIEKPSDDQGNAVWLAVAVDGTKIAEITTMEEAARAAEAYVDRAAGQGVVREADFAGYAVREADPDAADPDAGLIAEKQMSLFADTLAPAGDVTAASDQARGNYPIHVELVDTRVLASPLARVRSTSDAAAVLMEFADQAQENHLSLVLGENGLPLAVLRTSLGTMGAAFVTPTAEIGGALSIPGAREIYFAHNHPSGFTEPSPEDIGVLGRLHDLAKGAGLTVGPSIILGYRDGAPAWSAMDALGKQTKGVPSAPAGRGTKIPVQERVIARREVLPEKLDSAAKAIAYLDGLEGTGVLLLSTQIQPIGYLALTTQEMEHLKGDRAAPLSRLMQALHETNATRAIVRFAKDDSGLRVPEGALNLGTALKNMGISVVDTISTDGESMVNTAPVAREGGIFYKDAPKPEAGEAPKRGYIKIAPDRKIEIGLLENSDLSTFLHESGHMYLEVLRDLVTQSTASAGLAEDYGLLARWLGIEGLAADTAVPVEAQERFARGFEAYLYEGRAPSVELQSAFSRFKAWLVQVYRDIRSLDVELTPQVRAVFDRLVATDDEIARARAATGQGEIFSTAKDAGMTDAEFAQYRDVLELAHRQAVDELQETAMADLLKEKSRWWKEEEDALRAKYEEQARGNPVFQAYHLLTRGELLDGTPAPTPVKISRASIVERYGKEFLKNQSRRFLSLLSKDGGLHMDDVAEMFGFASGDEAIQKLAASPPMKTWVKEQVDAAMSERHGKFQADIAEAAIDAVHSDQTGQVLRAELRALRRKQEETRKVVSPAKTEFDRIEDEENAAAAAAASASGVGTPAFKFSLSAAVSIPPLSVFKDQARLQIGGMKVTEIMPHAFLRAEQRAGAQVEEALKHQDLSAAADAKQRQLTNHYLYVEAKQARDDADRILAHALSLGKKAAQIRLGKAGFGYLEQVNAILERYEFKATPVTELKRRESLLEWAKRKAENGLESNIPEWVLFDARKRNYRTLKVDELRGVRDTLKTIEHLALVENQLLGKQAGMDFKEATASLLNALTANLGEGKQPPLDLRTRTAVEKAGDTFGRFDASLMKAEQLFAWFDGGDIAGPWETFLFRPVAESQARESDLTVKHTEVLLKIFDEYGEKAGKRLDDKIHIDSLNEPLTRGAILSVALNTGNDGNYFKLLKGNGWGEAHVEEILSHLGEADWRFVQQVWDAIEELWPEIKGLEERLTGLAPPKVAAREFVNEFGTWRGGYYPVIYDPRFSKPGEKQEDARGEKLFDGSYIRATTEKGWTKSRIDEAAYPIQLSLDVLPSHVAGVIHDLAYREAIVQANRLLNDANVRAGIITTMGQPYHNALNKWLASIANDRNIDRAGLEFWNRFFSRVRTNATIVSMGFKATTMISQVVGLSNSLDTVSGKYLSPAVARFAKAPFEATAWVREKSGEMRHRFDTMDRDVRDGVRKLQGKDDPLAWFQGKAFAGIGVFDALVSVPTWMGAYAEGLDAKLSEEDAIAYADRAVRLSQGAGGAKDLAAVQRQGELFKLFTMFYSYFNALYGRLRNAGRMFSVGEESFGDLAWRSLILVILPATIQELLVARGPDDDEDPLWWATRKILTYPLSTVPILRDMVNSLDSGRDYQLTPVGQTFATTVKVAQRAKDVATGDREATDLLFPLVDLTGYAVGLPTAQAKITGRYLWDVLGDGEEIDSVPGFFRDTVFTRKKQ